MSQLIIPVKFEDDRYNTSGMSAVGAYAELILDDPRDWVAGYFAAKAELVPGNIEISVECLSDTQVAYHAYNYGTKAYMGTVTIG